jgi:cell wall-associated NlpC family hydrolase
MHRSVGIRIPRDASDQATTGQLVEQNDLLPGDLLFFAYEEGKGRAHHVGIYIGNQEMIHSPDSRGVIEIVKLDDSYRLIKEHSVSRRYW